MNPNVHKAQPSGLTAIGAIVAALACGLTGMIQGGARELLLLVALPPVAGAGLLCTVLAAKLLGLRNPLPIPPAALFSFLLGLPVMNLFTSDTRPDRVFVPAPGFAETLTISVPALAVTGKPQALGSLITRGPWKKIDYDNRQQGQYSVSSPPMPEARPWELVWRSEPEQGVQFESVYHPKVGKQVIFAAAGSYRVWAEARSEVFGKIQSQVAVVEVRAAPAP